MTSDGKRPPETAPTGPGPAARIGTAAATVRDRLRSRLYLGVPWATLLVCFLLITTYAVVQRGATSWSRPLVIPFVAWSYRHPTGLALGPFAHAGPEHLRENLLGVLAFGSLAEYAIGHRAPDDPGRSDPRVRAFVALPAGALLAGLVCGIFAWGPTVGASALVFAAAGVAIVHAPVATLLAVVARDALAVVADAVREPIVVATRATAGDPWWADLATQAHAFGFLLGVAIGTAVLVRRDESPPGPARLWLAVLLFGCVRSLWAVWWPSGDATVLARAPGVVLVVALASVCALGVTLAAGRGPRAGTSRARRVGGAALLVPLLAMAAIAVPVDAAGSATVPEHDGAVTVEGYAVSYVENASDGRVAPLTALTGGEAPRADGVVVVRPERGVWTMPVTAERLARDGAATIRVGSIRDARTVFATRRGWRVAGGGEAYVVALHPRDGAIRPVYASDPARASAVVDNRTVTVVPTGGSFELRIETPDGSVETAPMPGAGEAVAAGGLELRRADGRLVAVRNETRVTVATRTPDR